MDNETGTAASRLDDALQKQPHRYGFLQAMRLIECAYSYKVRFGQAPRPSHEPPIRLAQQVSLNFETASLVSYSKRKLGLVPLENNFLGFFGPERPNKAYVAVNVLKQRFFGLFGTNGVMPLHLSEYIYERIYRYRDYTLAAFADMFHHRLTCLFYRAWANNEPTVSFDRPHSDKFSTYIGSLAGFGTESLRERDAMPDLAKFYYTGFLSCQSKSAEGLRALLADYFRFPVSVQQFVGEWLTIQTSDLTRLGESPLTGKLGQSAVLGSQVWGCQHKFRVQFGALTLNEYNSLLPNGNRLAQLVAIIRNYSGDELSWDVQLILKKHQVPQAQLGATTQLGWTSWLGERHSDRDADDLKLNPFWGRL
jgi:type VI secretion system protein ImpH